MYDGFMTDDKKTLFAEQSARKIWYAAKSFAKQYMSAARMMRALFPIVAEFVEMKVTAVNADQVFMEQ